MNPTQHKAAVLVEALPYIQRFQGSVFVIKYGGHAMVDPEAAQNFARDVVLLASIGVRPVVVHGGGPQIKATLAELGIESEFKAGMRVTDARTMEVVRMVLVGKVNQEIVSMMNQAGGRAVGLSGADGNLLVGRKTTVDGEDVGRVGLIERVDDGELNFLTRGGFIPVIAPVAVDGQGQPLNINADLAAGAVAAHIKARKLLLMTDVSGVKDQSGETITHLRQAQVAGLIADGTAKGGMIPKLKASLTALEGGVRKVHIVDGRVLHALLLEIFTDGGVGTEIV
ncbi:MAG: acetylglutamate kinase [Bradymonadia bacterium]